MYEVAVEWLCKLSETQRHQNIVNNVVLAGISTS